MGSPLPIADPAPTDGALPDSVVDGSHSRTMHAYLHVPFCKVRCGYCDFNTYTSSELKGFRQNDFVTNISQEIALANTVLQNAKLPSRPLSTVFFGGGTPTQLAAAELAATLENLKATFGFASDVEITTEANPDDLDAAYLESLAKAGFTRISLGMQSAVPSVLKTLDRTHDPELVPKAVAQAKASGLQVSVDLIYGAPGETFDQWKQTVAAALALETDHISAYALIVEEGTKMARDIRSGVLTEPDEDLEADKYEYAESQFDSAGLHWYELSNWSTSSKTRSAHNLAYWQGQDWWGFGPGAHSHVGGVRWWNAKHPTTYAAALGRQQSPGVGRESLTSATRLQERVMLEARLRDGIEISLVREANPKVTSAIAQLIAEGLVDGPTAIRGRLILTLTGRLLADAVVRRILA